MSFSRTSGRNRIRRTFSDTQVVDILQSADRCSRAAMAAHYGVSKSAIGMILRGECYKHVAPEIPRPFAPGTTRPKQTCLDCVHCQVAGGSDESCCSLGVPEAGHRRFWASECPSYLTASLL